MKRYGIELAQGTSIENANIDYGIEFPEVGTETPGQLFFREDENLLYIRNSSNLEWIRSDAGSISVLTDNGDGSYEHNDGTGNITVIDTLPHTLSGADVFGGSEDAGKAPRLDAAGYVDSSFLHGNPLIFRGLFHPTVDGGDNDSGNPVVNGGPTWLGGDTVICAEDGTYDLTTGLTGSGTSFGTGDWLIFNRHDEWEVLENRDPDYELFIWRDGSRAPTADIPFGGNKITGLGDPVDDQDAATKLYVDSNSIADALEDGTPYARQDASWISLPESNNWIHANNGADFANSPSATGSFGIAIGHEAVASDTSTIAIGWNADATDGNAVAIGQSSDATFSDCVAIGSGSRATAFYSVGIGPSAKSTVRDSVAIGYRAESNTHSGVAIGPDAKITDALTSDVGGIVIGKDAQISNADTARILLRTDNAGLRVHANGSLETTPDGGTNWAAVGGGNNWINANGGSDYSTAPSAASAGLAIGDNASTTGWHAIAIGNNSVGVDRGIVIGGGATTDSTGGGVAIGNDATLTADSTGNQHYSIAIGNGATAVGKSGGTDVNVGRIAIGYNAQAIDSDNEIVIITDDGHANGVGLRVKSDGTLETTSDGGSLWIENQANVLEVGGFDTKDVEAFKSLSPSTISDEKVYLLKIISHLAHHSNIQEERIEALEARLSYLENK